MQTKKSKLRVKVVYCDSLMGEPLRYPYYVVLSCPRRCRIAPTYYTFEELLRDLPLSQYDVCVTGTSFSDSNPF